jgi:hypothetical protein
MNQFLSWLERLFLSFGINPEDRPIVAGVGLFCIFVILASMIGLTIWGIIVLA